MASVTTRDYRGWQVVNLETPQLRVDVVPGKGGDLTSVVHLTTGVELLWHTRWGLRARGSMTTPGSSEAALSEAYPGGWQSVFPNAGDAAHEHGSNGRCTVRCGPGLGRAACGGHIWCSLASKGCLVDPPTLGSYCSMRPGRRPSQQPDRAHHRGLTVHDARRTCATLLVDLEVHPRVIMRILRHADVSMTVEIYAKASSTATSEALRGLGEPPMSMSPMSAVAVLRCGTGQTEGPTPYGGRH